MGGGSVYHDSFSHTEGEDLGPRGEPVLSGRRLGPGAADRREEGRAQAKVEAAPGVTEMFIPRINIHNNGTLKLLLLGCGTSRDAGNGGLGGTWGEGAAGQGGSGMDPQPQALDGAWE